MAVGLHGWAGGFPETGPLGLVELLKPVACRIPVAAGGDLFSIPAKKSKYSLQKVDYGYFINYNNTTSYLLNYRNGGLFMEENAFLEAAENGDIEAVKRHLSEGTDVDTSDEHKRTALMKAAKHGHTEIVKCLLDEGADVNVRDNRGTSALYWASSNGHHEIVQLLIKHRSDVEVHDDRGWSAKDQASYHQHDDIVHMLEEAGAR
ncbi:Ankyrin repeat-containing protein [Fodinibius roseus]|uniref:Ankyrin repeat-containing protein n=2 Tax=Fodinibius roseus TaxID=1194090 RepID=A0A1M4XDG3_9BACT|nr:ankyrin repeat domain-containing protein [Fodinibius roseus]SHE91639.1 Ankyrin repeat-containing protein [Fodinibius roseus]